MRLAGIVIALVLAAACTRRDPRASTREDAATLRDGGSVTTPDAHVGSDAASPGIDAAAPHDAGRDTSAAGDAGVDAAGSSGDLDPQLDVPPASNDSCGTPGSESECSGISVCRFYSSTEGRCESCTTCGNLFAPCASGEDCDILFVCFRGQCTNFCTLGTSECGAPTDCIDIGHPTRGACRPR